MRQTIIPRFILTALLGLCLILPVWAQAPILAGEERIQPAIARHGMVSSQEAVATRIGVDVLKRGGNAIDAAVATGFALAVTLPRAGNLGGGGFMLVHLANGESHALDFRETAPTGATPTMFLDAKGEADPKKSRDSGLAVGVPGSVAGLAEAHRLWGSGKLTLADLISPAVKLAREGIVVSDDLADSLPRAGDRLSRWPSTRAIFHHADGKPYLEGETLVQADLAATLEAIAAQGPRAFYEGAIAARIAAAVRQAGGVMTADDLAAYRPVVRQPVRGRYRGHEVLSMPPPSSGGVHLIQILNILEGYDLAAMGPGADAFHLMAEAMRRAYADRAVFLGDPDFVPVPVARLIARDYAARLRATINPRRARPSARVRGGYALPPEPDQTTHYSVVDGAGNAVAVTTTLNFSYGLGLVAEGTGVLLNNELDDFSAKAGAANAYGLIGSDANLPAPKKRPLSSMSPTIVLKDGKPLLVTGSPGGSRIITTVLQVILNVLDHRMGIAEAVSAPRIHHQWMPDELFVERGLSPDTIRALDAKGHKVSERSPSGSASSILLRDGVLLGAADPRQRGTLATGW